ncbi:MAG TPA: aromatic aminobenezylarsenical efflux permease ArsG family transporter [Phycisphaerae bacterium]|nr:aromatic aminobenezylarsenical efflux permease ArsG family transporter [Phycisphaerae bacterium]
METLLLGTVSALWLGILTSISPCPMATNIAAISFIGKRVGRPLLVILSGLLYTLGRTVAYVAVAVVAVGGLLAIPAVSDFLQTYMNRLLGPVLIVAGVVLLELVPIRFSTSVGGERAEKLAEKGGLLGAGLLGILFALSFCPISAGLFFASLLPLALKHESRLLLPTAFGVGTALPVVVFAVVIALSARSVGKMYGALAKVEWWARRITGVLFLLVGVYYCLLYIFGITALQPWN